MIVTEFRAGNGQGAGHIRRMENTIGVTVVAVMIVFAAALFAMDTEGAQMTPNALERDGQLFAANPSQRQARKPSPDRLGPPQA